MKGVDSNGGGWRTLDNRVNKIIPVMVHDGSGMHECIKTGRLLAFLRPTKKTGVMNTGDSKESARETKEQPNIPWDPCSSGIATGYGSNSQIALI